MLRNKEKQEDTGAKQPQDDLNDPHLCGNLTLKRKGEGEAVQRLSGLLILLYSCI